MNEQFQEYLMGILEKTGEFLGSEIPEVAQQILSFSAYSMLIKIIALSCVAGVYGYAFYLWNKFTHTWNDKDDGVVGRAWAKIFTLILSFIYIFKFFNYITVLVKIYIAPKVFLLEYASGLVR